MISYRKEFNAKHCLVYTLEKWKESVENSGTLGACITDLYKAFDCLHHGLLIPKLDGYGFDLRSAKLIQQCL